MTCSISLSSRSTESHLFCHSLLVASLVCFFMSVGGIALWSDGYFSLIAASIVAMSTFSFLTIPTRSGTQQKHILRFLVSAQWIIIVISSAVGETHSKILGRWCSFHFPIIFQNFVHGSSYCIHFRCRNGYFMRESSTVCIILQHSCKAHVDLLLIL